MQYVSDVVLRFALTNAQLYQHVGDKLELRRIPSSSAAHDSSNNQQTVEVTHLPLLARLSMQVLMY